MRTIVWWTVWGLAVAAGMVGLLESLPHHAHLLLAVPLLSGAVAAAILRIHLEYHYALQHAKRLLISSFFLMSGLGYLFVKANAYGPFATGTSCKAFLGATFEMSLPEVQRALGRHLGHQDIEKPLPERAQEWVIEALPLPGRRMDERFVLPLTLDHVPCATAFIFKNRKLARVEIMFDPVPLQEAHPVAQWVRDELEKEYKPITAGLKKGMPPLLFRKESVEAAIEIAHLGHARARIKVVLQYLPLTEAEPPPLSVESNAF